MPFCPSCGNQVSPNDRFCGRCGSAQPISSSASSTGWKQGTSGLSPETAATLCYIPFFGWIFGLFVLASEKFRRQDTTRFHAFQGLYLFVAWLLFDMVLDFAHIPFSFGLEKIVKLVVICTWIYMLIQTHQGQLIRLPFISELADKSVNEQK